MSPARFTTIADMDGERLARALDALACAADPEVDCDDVSFLTASCAVQNGYEGPTEVTLELTYGVSTDSDPEVVWPLSFETHGSPEE